MNARRELGIKTLNEVTKGTDKRLWIVLRTFLFLLDAASAHIRKAIK